MTENINHSAYLIGPVILCPACNRADDIAQQGLAFVCACGHRIPLIEAEASVRRRIVPLSLEDEMA